MVNFAETTDCSADLCTHIQAKQIALGQSYFCNAQLNRLLLDTGHPCNNNTQCSGEKQKNM